MKSEINREKKETKNFREGGTPAPKHYPIWENPKKENRDKARAKKKGKGKKAEAMEEIKTK